MALITIPSFPQKNVLQTYNLNTTDLIALVNQNYFKDKENWKRVIVTYVSSPSNQISIISFVPTSDEILSAQGFFAPEARSIFQITNISIYDKQNGRFRLERSQIPGVENYNLILAGLTSQLSFYGIGFTGGDASTSISFDALDSNRMIIGTQNAISLESSATWETVLNLPDGSLDSATTLKIMDSKITNIFYNNDLTKAWIIGQLGTSCCGQALPPLPSGSEYGSDPYRLVELDIVTNVLTLKADLRNYTGVGQQGTYLGNVCYTVIVDESESIGVVTYGNFVTGYSLTSGELVWFKQFVQIPDNYNGSTKPRLLARASDGFYIGAGQYDNITEANNAGIIKASFATGEKVSGFDSTPSFTSGKFSFWSSSPDGLKQVILGQPVGSSQPAAIYIDGTVSSVNLTNPDDDTYAYAISGTNDYFYVVGLSGNIRKYDYSGNFIAKVVPSSSWTGISPPQFSSTAFGVYEGFLFCADRNGQAILKFNETTSARVTSFLGIKASQSSGNFGQFFFFNSNKMAVNKFDGNSYYSYVTLTDKNIAQTNAIAIVDYSNQTTISYLSTNNYYTYMNGKYPMTSSLLPNKIIGLDSSFGPHVFDTTQDPWVQESGWPTRGGTGPALGGAAIIGDYLYIGSSGGANGIQMADSLGSFIGTQLVRINLTTKLIDRTFLPEFPDMASAYGDQTVITSTDNYIYICLCSTFSGNATLFRLKKSDLSTQKIQASDLGLPVAFGNYKVNVTQIAPNTIVMFPDKSSYSYSPGVDNYTTFGGKPYLVLNETTLALTGTQTSTSTDAPVRLVYNPNTGLLCGLVFVSGGVGSRLVTYEISTASRSVVSQTLSNFNGDNYLQTGTVFPMTYEGENILFICSIPLIFNRRIYTGVVRMNPLGVLNN